MSILPFRHAQVVFSSLIDRIWNKSPKTTVIYRLTTKYEAVWRDQGFRVRIIISLILACLFVFLVGFNVSNMLTVRSLSPGAREACPESKYESPELHVIRLLFGSGPHREELVRTALAL